MQKSIRAWAPWCLPALIALVSPAPAAAQLYESVGIRAQGMSGAFVAVSDDATASWWNPAGLSDGPYFNGLLESDRATGVPGGARVWSAAVALPALGLSYYRLPLSGIQPPGSTGLPTLDRQDQGALSELGVTVGQSVGDRLVVASTIKLVHALGETRGDVDVGAIVSLGRARVGASVKNLSGPGFSEGIARVDLPRQVRAGVAFTAGPPGRHDLTVAVDADLTTTATAFGDERHLAAGAEAWTLDRRLALRAGGGVNTVGTARPSASAGASVALRSSVFVDAQVTGGSDEARNGWGIGLRVTFY